MQTETDTRHLGFISDFIASGHTFDNPQTYKITQTRVQMGARIFYTQDKIECIWADNGLEFTRRLISGLSEKLMLFQTTTVKLGIYHKLIKPYTPRYNGKLNATIMKITTNYIPATVFCPVTTLISS